MILILVKILDDFSPYLMVLIAAENVAIMHIKSIIDKGIMKIIPALTFVMRMMKVTKMATSISKNRINMEITPINLQVSSEVVSH